MHAYHQDRYICSFIVKKIILHRNGGVGKEHSPDSRSTEAAIARQWPLHNPGARSCDRTSRRILPRGFNSRSLFQRPKRPAFSLRGIPSLFSSDDHVPTSPRPGEKQQQCGRARFSSSSAVAAKKAKGMFPSFGKLCVSVACLSPSVSLFELGAGRLSWAGLGTLIACSLHA